MEKRVLSLIFIISLLLIVSVSAFNFKDILQDTSDWLTGRVTGVNQSIGFFNIVMEEQVYLVGEEVIIEYKSDVQDLNASANLTFPDKTIKKIKLPYFFKPDQAGVYEINAFASKEDYYPATATKKFIVNEDTNKPVENNQIIENKTEVAEIFCNENKKCELGETPQGCPTDCIEITNQTSQINQTNLTNQANVIDSSGSSNKKAIYVIVFGVIILLVIFFLFRRNRNSEISMSKEEINKVIEKLEKGSKKS